MLHLFELLFVTLSPVACQQENKQPAKNLQVEKKFCRELFFNILTISAALLAHSLLLLGNIF